MYVTKVIENHPPERNPAASPHSELTPFHTHCRFLGLARDKSVMLGCM